MAAQMGVSEGKAVGQWFGPNTIAQVLRCIVFQISLCGIWVWYLYEYTECLY